VVWLSTVTVCDALVPPTAVAGKVRVSGETAAGNCPVPLIATVTNPPGRLPLMVISPLIAPGKLGEKVTVTVQVPSDARVEPQVVVIG
jgi:hypothetical protein